MRVAELVHPEARLKAAEVLTHPHGQGPYALPPHGAPPPVPGSDPVEAAHATFAESVAHRLHEGRTQGQFDRFVIVAPPSFLALVDARLDPDTAHRRERSIAQAWASLPDEEIAGSLASALGE